MNNMNFGMQKKTIEKYISNRINYWVWSIKDPNLLKDILNLKFTDPENLPDEDKAAIESFQDKVKASVIVTGGCITSMLLGEDVNDVDVYFNDQIIAEKVSQYYLNQMIAQGNLTEDNGVSRINVVPHEDDSGGVHIYIKSQGVTGDGIDTKNYRYFEGEDVTALDNFFKEYKKNVREDDMPKHSVAFLSSNAITLNNDIQIIVRFTGTPDEIHSNFDFVHATNYWTQETGVVYREDALIATLERRLYYIGSRFPLSTIFRLRKFISRGWRISAGEIVKICWDMSKIDLTNIYEFRNQVCGMDSAYFHEVISILQGDSDKPLERTYLFEVINQIFNDGKGAHDVDDEGHIIED